MSTYKPKKSPHYQYDFQFKGRRFHGSTGCKTKAAADRYEARLKEKAALGEADKEGITLDVACGIWWQRKGERQDSAPTTRYQIGYLIDGLGGNRLLADIGFRDFDDYVAKRLGTKNKRGKLNANATVNREIEIARRIWKLAKARGYDVGDKEIEWGKLMLTEPKERSRELSSDEEAALFAKLPADLATVVEFAMLSGQRRTAVVTLRWSDVDLQGRRATITLKGADKGRHTFPLTPRMVAIIANRPRVAAQVFTYVCERPAPPRGDRPARLKGHRYPFSRQGWTRRWKRALKEAGVDDFRFHDLRHTAGTRLTRASGNLKITQKLLGHTDIATTARYAHATEGDVLNAMILAESRNSPELIVGGSGENVVDSMDLEAIG